MFEAKWKKLDLNTCITVRRLRLNKRGRHTGKKIKEHSITNGQGSTNQNNLTIIEPVHSHNIQNRLKAALFNIQSLNPKRNDLVTYLNDTKLDLCILTETWLREEDNSWVSCWDLKIANHRMSVSNRINRRRRGHALVHKTALPTKKLDDGQLQIIPVCCVIDENPGIEHDNHSCLSSTLLNQVSCDKQYVYR